MKYALVDGQRQEPQPGLSGICPNCTWPMVAKCGDINIWHWAHRGGRICDPWWEQETKWHRAWKEEFPNEWHECRHQADNGEWHIADVKTDKGWVLEFQHSHIHPEERRARNAFYEKLVWVVNGLRRKTDQTQFFNALQNGRAITPLIVRISFHDEVRLLRDWAGSSAPVFFDFGEKFQLMLLLPHSPDGGAYIGPCSRANIIQIYRNGTTQQALNFENFLKDWPKTISDYNSSLRTQSQNQFIPRIYNRRLRQTPRL
jgi:hypothetical protein